MPKMTAGKSRLAAVMRGASSTAPTTTPSADAASFCITSIWSTPKNPGNFARKLKRVVDNCTTHKRISDAAKDEPAAE